MSNNKKINIQGISSETKSLFNKKDESQEEKIVSKPKDDEKLDKSINDSMNDISHNQSRENENKLNSDDKKDSKKLEQYLLISHYFDNHIIKSINVKPEFNKKGEVIVKKERKTDKLNLLISDLHKKEISRNDVFLINGVDFTYRAYKKPPKKKKKIVLNLVEKLKALKKTNNDDLLDIDTIDSVYEKYNLKYKANKETTTPTPHDEETSNKEECNIF